MPNTSSPQVTAFDAEVRRNFRHNFWMNLTEGGVYMGGMVFLAGDTIMPALVKELGGAVWLIALMPIMAGLGSVIPQILTAHRVEGMTRVKTFVCTMGVFQRLPYLLAALALFFLHDSHPVLTLAAVALAPLMSGFMGGVSATAWLEIISKTIPENRRSSLWASRQIVSALMGIVAGMGVTFVLGTWPGATGFGILHLMAFLCLAVSFFIFLQVREPIRPAPMQAKPKGFRSNLRSLPNIVQVDTRFRNFLCTRLLANGVFVMAPFLGLHALEATHLGKGFLGTLLVPQMIGGITGSLLASRLGDRHGGKIVLQISQTVLFFTCLAAAFNVAAGGFLTIFFLYGMGMNMNNVGQATLSLEICPTARRPTYQALLALLNGPTMLLASGLSTLVHRISPSFIPAALLTAAAYVAANRFLARIEEPRDGARRARSDWPVRRVYQSTVQRPQG